MKASKKSLVVLMTSILLASCSVDGSENDSTSSDSASDSASSAVSTSSESASGSAVSSSASAVSEKDIPTADFYLDLTGGKVSLDNSEWTEISTSNVSFFDGTLSVKYTKENGESTGLVKIDAASFASELKIYISGSISKGGVKIQSNGKDAINISLNGVAISSSNYPCLEVTKGSPANVVLYGTSVFVDGRKYGYGYGEEEYATTSRNYVAEGSDSKGTLYSKGDLTISGTGTLSVTQAYKNCIASKDGILTVNGGSLSLKNYISSSETGKNGLFAGQGIVVNDGTILFDGKGIVSTCDIRKANGFKTDDDDYPESYFKINGGTTTVTTYNGKGINAPEVYIAGGNNTFNVTGTTAFSEHTSTGTWYDADGVEESGTVKFSAEGIEGDSKMEISGGTTIISAVDDGLNVSATGGTLTISGGFVYVKAQGDGLDSNGDIIVSGGTVVVSQTGGGNSPIDCGDGNYSFKVTGTEATVFAFGSSDMFNESIPSSTVSPMIYSTSLGNSSSSLGVNGIIGVTSPQTYSAALLVSSSLTNGTSYSFVKGGKISGTEISGSGVYLPANVSGGTSVSATATTEGGSGMGGGGMGTGGSGIPGGMSGGTPGNPDPRR